MALFPALILLLSILSTLKISFQEHDPQPPSVKATSLCLSVPYAVRVVTGAEYRTHTAELDSPLAVTIRGYPRSLVGILRLELTRDDLRVRQVVGYNQRCAGRACPLRRRRNFLVRVCTHSTLL